jgi:hypothetical protein
MGLRVKVLDCRVDLALRSTLRRVDDPNILDGASIEHPRHDELPRAVLFSSVLRDVAILHVPGAHYLFQDFRMIGQGRMGPGSVPRLGRATQSLRLQVRPPFWRASR